MKGRGGNDSLSGTTTNKKEHNEDIDQSGRNARHHRWSRTGDGLGRRERLRKVLQDQLQLLPEMLGRKVRLLLQELLQVGESFCGAGAGPKKACLPPLIC